MKRNFRIEITEIGLKVLQGFLSNNPPGGNEILNNISKSIADALDNNPQYEGFVRDVKTIRGWCLQLGLRLLDQSYYEDTKLYTAKEFEDKVPRNMQV